MMFPNYASACVACVIVFAVHMSVIVVSCGFFDDAMLRKTNYMWYKFVKRATRSLSLKREET